MKTLLDISSQYTKTSTLGVYEEWFTIPNSNISKIFQKESLINISFQFIFSSGYYRAEIDCIGLLEFASTRDLDVNKRVIKIFGQVMCGLSVGSFRNDTWHTFNLKIDNSKCWVTIDNSPYVIDKSIVIPTTLISSQFKIMSHSSLIGIRNLLITYDEPKYLIYQNEKFYTIKPEYYPNGNYQPLDLLGGMAPNSTDFETLGFNSILQLTEEVINVNGNFIPIDRFTNMKLFKYQK